MLNKRVAVIMSLYNKDNKDYFFDAVNSMISQDYPLDIYIYIDGVVCDELEGVINFFEKNYDSIFIIRNEVNRGLAFALNTLIDIVCDKGYEFIARMDSDDISYSHRISTQIEFFDKNHEIDVLGSGCREFGASYALKKKILPSAHEHLVDFCITRCPFIHPTVVFRNYIFLHGYRYPENTKMTEDLSFWFLLLSNGFKFSNLEVCLLDYRLDENTVKRRKGVEKALNEFNIRFLYMLKLKRFSIRSFIFIFSRLFFHILPLRLMKFAYKNIR